MLNWTRLAPYIRKNNLTSFTLFYNLEQSLLYASWLTLSAHQPSETDSPVSDLFHISSMKTDTESEVGNEITSISHFGRSLPKIGFRFRKGNQDRGTNEPNQQGPLSKARWESLWVTKGYLIWTEILFVFGHVIHIMISNEMCRLNKKAPFV